MSGSIGSLRRARIIAVDDTRLNTYSQGLDYFSIDVEASGPIPGIYNLLSLGVTHVRKYQGIYRPFADLYLEVKPIFPRFWDQAMNVHGLDLERLRIEGLEPKDAMEKLIAWVSSQQKDSKERPVFVAHNAPFDWMFCAFYLCHTGMDNPFGHSALDIKALAMGKLGLPWNQTTLKAVASLLPGLPERDTKLIHHAGADARYQAQVFSALMNFEPGR